MDDLSVALNNSGIGGNLGDAFLNHLCYTDETTTNLNQKMAARRF